MLALDVASATNIYLTREGVWGRVVTMLGRIGGWRMTGSASKRWTLRVSWDSLLRERVQGEGGVSVGPDGRLADDRKRLLALDVASPLIYT